MFPINPQMLSAIVKMKLDEILQGKAPEGFRIKSQTADKIELVSENIDQLEGIKINQLHISFTYGNTEIIISHE